MKKFRLITSANGLNYTEDFDAEVLKAMRIAAGKSSAEWPIKEVTLEYTITNDPQGRVFEDYDSLQVEINILREEAYQPQMAEYFSDPQPAGLND